MNTQLYNSLIQAQNFLVTVKSNEDDLIRRKELIRNTSATYRPFFPNYNHKDFSWITFYFLL